MVIFMNHKSHTTHERQLFLEFQKWVTMLFSWYLESCKTDRQSYSRAKQFNSCLLLLHAGWRLSQSEQIVLVFAWFLDQLYLNAKHFYFVGIIWNIGSHCWFRSRLSIVSVCDCWFARAAGRWRPGWKPMSEQKRSRSWEWCGTWWGFTAVRMFFFWRLWAQVNTLALMTKLAKVGTVFGKLGMGLWGFVWGWSVSIMGPFGGEGKNVPCQ